jgi:signal peptidase I
VLKRVLAAVAAGVVVLVVGAAVVYVVGHRHFKRERLPSESMQPTIKLGEVVTMDTAAYDDRPPAIGDIVAFHAPAGVEAGGGCAGQRTQRQMCPRPASRRSRVLYVKRIVAGPGDRVAIAGGRVVRNGRRVREPYTQACSGDACDLPRPIVVPAGDYLILGDNRGASDDSRFFGPIPRGWIVGRVERCGALDFHCRPRR